MNHWQYTEAELRPEFTIYCIESITRRPGISHKEVYRRCSR